MEIHHQLFAHKMQIGSRRVIQWAALIMILQGVINKFGAVFIMIPDPVVGGLFCVMFGMITAFGLSALQYVDLRSSRNLYIIGISLFFPLVLCQWMQKHPGAINTGINELDSTLTVLLSTTILVGGCLGCLLDNLIPGSSFAMLCANNSEVNMSLLMLQERKKNEVWSHGKRKCPWSKANQVKMNQHRPPLTFHTEWTCYEGIAV